MLHTDTEEVPPGAEAEAAAAEPERMVLFVVGEHRFAVPIDRIREIIPARPYTPLPGSGGHVCGLINLRGQVITALDLRHRLGMPVRAEGQRPMNVVVRTEDGAVSLLVDQIGEVIETDARHFESPPDTVTAQARDLIRGAYKLDGTLLLALDVPRTVEL